jgi:hypothetical protein
MPTRDNWIVEGSTVFTKAQAVYVDQIMKTLRQCCKIEGNSSHGESATKAGLRGGGEGGGTDRQTNKPGAAVRPASESLNKTVEVGLTTKTGH